MPALPRTPLQAILLAISLGGLVWCAPLPGRAEDVVRVVLVYRADEGCASRDALEGQVSARTSRVRWTYGDQSDLSLDVGITTSATGATADVLFQRPGENAVSRVITGRTCEEVLEALGLVIALSVDPEASTGAVESVPAVSPPVSRETTEGAPASLPSSPSAPAWQVGAGGGVVFLAGVAPDLLPGVAAFGEVSRSGAGLSPSFRLGGRHAARVRLRDAGGSVSVEVATLFAAACPLSGRLGGSLLLRPCVVGEYGRLGAAGSDAAQTVGEWHPWAAAGTELRLEWNASSTAYAEAGAGVSVPLVRTRFLRGDQVIYEAGPLVVELGLVFGFRVP